MMREDQVQVTCVMKEDTKLIIYLFFYFIVVLFVCGWKVNKKLCDKESKIQQINGCWNCA